MTTPTDSADVEAIARGLGDHVRIVRGTATRWIVQKRVNRGRWDMVGVYPTEGLATQKAAAVKRHLETER